MTFSDDHFFVVRVQLLDVNWIIRQVRLVQETNQFDSLSFNIIIQILQATRGLEENKPLDMDQRKRVLKYPEPDQQQNGSPATW